MIYLRKPERLLTSGRRPTAERRPCNFQIKFGGSFVAMAEQSGNLNRSSDGREQRIRAIVRVNSVGTIVEVRTRRSLEATDQTGRNKLKIPKTDTTKHRRHKLTDS